MDKAFIAAETAKMMLEVEAIKFNAEKPFIFTAGWASPVYVDCRWLISFPRLRKRLMRFATETIMIEIGTESLDAIAGGETAGIPYAAWIADRLDLPMLYVRKKAKGFGRNAQIEGSFKDGDRVLLVEDLATDGRSKLIFTDALRQAGAKVSHSFVVFYYGIFNEGVDVLKDRGIGLSYLATWWDVLTQARASGAFPAATLEQVEAFLNNPAAWSAAHGGRSSFETPAVTG
jgi:orotate phosphoribosyltransferase